MSYSCCCKLDQGQNKLHALDPVYEDFLHSILGRLALKNLICRSFSQARWCLRLSFSTHKDEVLGGVATAARLVRHTAVVVEDTEEYELLEGVMTRNGLKTRCLFGVLRLEGTQAGLRLRVRLFLKDGKNVDREKVNMKERR